MEHKRLVSNATAIATTVLLYRTKHASVDHGDVPEVLAWRAGCGESSRHGPCATSCTCWGNCSASSYAPGDSNMKCLVAICGLSGEYC